MSSLHMVARALGVDASDDGCECQLCGDSPFESAGLAASLYGSGFCDWDARARPVASELCAGCLAVMSGRPGREPPPLRTRSLAIVDGELRVLRRHAELWPYLDAPHGAPHVVSWATSGKRHHALRAGVSTSERMLIGSDQHTIEYVPDRDRALLDAVLSMLASLTGKPQVSRAAILSGVYGAPAIERLGASRWARAESVISRHRGTPLLDLVVAAAPCLDRQPEEGDVIDPADEAAAALIGALARGSSMRVRDGKQFWGGVFAHRVQRFSRLPLSQFVSRLVTELQVEPHSEAAQSALDQLARMDDERAENVERAVRERSGLVVALAYRHRKLTPEPPRPQGLFAEQEQTR